MCDFWGSERTCGGIMEITNTRKKPCHRCDDRASHFDKEGGFLLIGLTIHIAFDVALLTILDNLLDLLCKLYLKTVFIK